MGCGGSRAVRGLVSRGASPVPAQVVLRELGGPAAALAPECALPSDGLLCGAGMCILRGQAGRWGSCPRSCSGGCWGAGHPRAGGAGGDPGMLAGPGPL